MTHLDELREREPEVAEYIEQHEEQTRKNCPGDCSDCTKINTCFN